MPELLFNPENHPKITYNDAFMVPQNSLLFRIEELVEEGNISRDDYKRMMDLHSASMVARETSWKFVKDNKRGDPTLQLAALQAHKTFRDFVLDMTADFPELRKVFSRDDVDFAPVDGLGNTPVMITNMDHIVGKDMCEAAALMGGYAAIDQYKTADEIGEIAKHLHSRVVPYETPIRCTGETLIGDLRQQFTQRGYDTAVVEDADGKLIGMIGAGDIDKKDDKWKVSQIEYSDKELGVAEHPIQPIDAIRMMKRNHFLPIINADSRVVGAFHSRERAALPLRYRPNVDPDRGGLAFAAAVGAFNSHPVDRTKMLIDAGVRALVHDTAHYDNLTVAYRNLREIMSTIENFANRPIPVIAGNVVTRSAVRDILAEGAKVVKVGIGPGAACTTREVSGVGMPQLSAILECAEEAMVYGGHVMADGGIRKPRDIALALAAGASSVMYGSIYTATFESATELLEDSGRFYATQRGMASRAAGDARKNGQERAVLEHDLQKVFRDTVGQREEGTSGFRVYQQTENNLGCVKFGIHQAIDGLTSGAGFAGARDMAEYPQLACIGIQHASGYAEGNAYQAMHA